MPANLYRRGAVYYGRWKLNGRLQRVSLQTGNRVEAGKRLKRIREKAERQAWGTEAASWQDAVVAYSRGVLDAGGVRPTTAQRYRVSLRQLDPHLADAKLPEIDIARIATIVAARQAEKATNATIRRDLTAMSRVLAFAASKQLIACNPAADYDRSFIREIRPPLTLPSMEDVEAAAAAVDPLRPGLGPLLRFLRANGCRSNDALAARWEHINAGRWTIHGKGGRTRTIDVVALPEPGGARGRLFPDMPETSGKLSSLWQWAQRKTGCPRFRIHDLRHAYAVAEVRRRRDIYDLSKHLGHSSVKVTEIYLRWQ